MTAYRLQYTTLSRRDLRRLSLAAAQKILLSLSAQRRPLLLCQEPGRQPPSYPVYTHRIGDYRAILTILDDILLSLVLEIGHRGSIY